jgi:hypothetical protein
MTHPPAVPPALRDLTASLVEPQSMRRGSVSERFVKCSKAGCACASDPKARHGPYYSLTRAVRGQTQSRFLNLAQATLARRQVEAGQSFRKKLDEYWRACEQWADAELDQSAAASEPAAQKGGSQALSKRRWRKKSRR